MNLLKRLFSRYTGFLRSLKLTYVLNNVINYRKLKHNKSMLKDLGLRHNVIGPIGTSDLPETDEVPWLDGPDALDQLKSHPRWSSFDDEMQRLLIQFVEEGYMVLKGFYSAEEVLGLNREIDQLRSEKSIDFNYSGSKLMDVHEVSSIVDHGFFRNQRLLDILSFLFGRDVLPFQTINFVKGSQQKAHSDSIHMSTYPPGYLLAAWTALEDIDMAQGPVFYYPGSHRLPYVSCDDYESGNTEWTIGKNSYKNYEKYIEALISSNEWQPTYFKPKAGDVLIWHANLLHGGLPIEDPALTRRSMVGHYYAQGVFCYHEISQRPALIKDNHS